MTECYCCRRPARWEHRGHWYCGEHYPPTRWDDDDETVRRGGKLMDRDRAREWREDE